MKIKGLLTPAQEKIIREQIQKNGQVIHHLVLRIDLLINKEGHHNDSELVCQMRKKLALLMEENDTFRKVFWSHVQSRDAVIEDNTYEAVRYLIVRIKNRNQAFTGSISAAYEVGTGVKSN